MQRIAVVAMLLLANACGGESASGASSGGSGGVGVGGTGGASGTGAGPGTGGGPATGKFAWPPKEPSFSLTLLKKDTTLTGPAFFAERLDFKESGGSFEASLGSKSACSVTVTASAVSFDGCTKVDQVTVEELVLPRAADGALVGTFQAASRYKGLFQGDMLMNEVTKFSGSVTPDTTAPEAEIFATTVLPWDGLSATVDEGIDEKQLVAAASAVPLSGSPPPITWKAVPGTPAWSGARSLVGAFADWAALADSPTFELTLGSLTDPSGNASTPVKATVKTLGVGKPAVVHDFENGALVLSATGSATVESGVTPGVCESGACMVLGPGDQCAGAGGMLRGLLDVSGKSKVRLRSRLVSSSKASATKFAIRLIAASGEKTVTPVGNFDSTAATPVLSLGFGATFADDVIAAPAAASVVGFEVYLPTESDPWCSPGPTVALVLEKIAAE